MAWDAKNSSWERRTSDCFAKDNLCRLIRGLFDLRSSFLRPSSILRRPWFIFASANIEGTMNKGRLKQEPTLNHLAVEQKCTPDLGVGTQSAEPSADK
jgi:hypothetical protein